jgi:hypothetical protein
VNGLDDPNALSTLANPTAITIYTAQYTDANGCTGIAGTSTVIPGVLPITGFTFNQISNYVVIFESNIQQNQTTTWQLNGVELFGDSVSYDFPFDDDYLITQIVSNACGSDTLVLQIEVVKQVGIEELANLNLTIYPNPAFENVLIRVDDTQLIDAVMQVFAADGKLVHQSILKEQTTILSVSDWSSGLYEIVVSSESKIWKGKLIR